MKRIIIISLFIIAIAFLIYLTNSCFTNNPDDTNNKESRDRYVINEEAVKNNQAKTDTRKFNREIYMKLPLLQPSFHWFFTEREKFLKGKLELVITSGNDMEKITIFKDGAIDDAWEEVGCHDDKVSKIYFGFTSKKAYSVSETDKVDLILTLDEDVKGIGADCKGTLKSGTYKASSQFTLYHLENYTKEKDINAYLNKDNWNVHWKLDITSNKGWMEEKYNKKHREKLTDNKENYTIGVSIESDGKRVVSIVNHKSKEFYFEHFRNHNDFLAYLNENKAKMPDAISCDGDKSITFVSICKELEKLLAPTKLSYDDGQKHIGPTIKEPVDFFIKYERKKTTK